MTIAASRLSKLLMSLKASSRCADDRRRARRVTVVTRGLVRILDGDRRERRFSVLTRDVSVSGLGLIAAAPIERGVRICVDLPDGAEEGSAETVDVITITCKVRYCRAMADGLWGVGVEFVDDPDLSGSAVSLSSDQPCLAQA